MTPGHKTVEAGHISGKAGHMTAGTHPGHSRAQEYPSGMVSRLSRGDTTRDIGTLRRDTSPLRSESSQGQADGQEKPNRPDCSRFCAGQCDPLGTSCHYAWDRLPPVQYEEPEIPEPRIIHGGQIVVGILLGVAGWRLVAVLLRGLAGGVL